MLIQDEALHNKSSKTSSVFLFGGILNNKPCKSFPSDNTFVQCYLQKRISYGCFWGPWKAKLSRKWVFRWIRPKKFAMLDLDICEEFSGSAMAKGRLPWKQELEEEHVFSKNSKIDLYLLECLYHLLNFCSFCKQIPKIFPCAKHYTKHRN